MHFAATPRDVPAARHLCLLLGFLALAAVMPSCTNPVTNSCCNSDDCGSGEYCRFEGEAPDDVMCYAEGGSGECRAFAREGDSCKGVHCISGLRCFGAEANPICRPPSGIDGPCTEKLDCAKGLVCNRALEPPVCRAPGADGEPCRATSDCADPLICFTAYLGPACHPSGSGALGQRCNEDAECDAGLSCNNATAQCIVPHSLQTGDICAANEQCISDVCVNSDLTDGTPLGHCE